MVEVFIDVSAPSPLATKPCVSLHADSRGPSSVDLREVQFAQSEKRRLPLSGAPRLTVESVRVLQIDPLDNVVGNIRTLS